MTQYLRELFINNEKPLTRSQYFVMLSMLWVLSSIFLTDLFSGSISTIFMAKLGAEELAEFVVLMNIHSMFGGVSLPWAFAALLMAFCCVRKAYRIKSILITVIMAYIVFVFFRILVLLPMLISGTFDQMWASAGGLPDLQAKLDVVKTVWLFVFFIGVVIIVYPLFKLVNNQQSVEIASKGISRERFAKIVLFVNAFLLFLSLAIVGLFKSKLMNSIDKDVFLFMSIAFSILVFIFSTYIIWQRLKNANKSILYFVLLLIWISMIGIVVFIAEKTENPLIISGVPFLISIGVIVSSLFICYLYLVPSAEESTV